MNGHQHHLKAMLLIREQDGATPARSNWPALSHLLGHMIHLNWLGEEAESQWCGSLDRWGGWGHASRKVGTLGGNIITVGSSSNSWLKLSSDNQKWGQRRRTYCPWLTEWLCLNRVHLWGRRLGVGVRAEGGSVCPHPRSDHYLMVWIDSFFWFGLCFYLY